jgi:hypothetical protein
MRMIFAVSRPGLLAQYTALVEFHKHHQPGFAETSLNRPFQFSESLRDLHPRVVVPLD